MGFFNGFSLKSGISLPLCHFRQIEFPLHVFSEPILIVGLKLEMTPFDVVITLKLF